VYYEEYQYVNDAITREKQLKGWLRAKKVALIDEMNPEWRDLAADWYDDAPVIDHGNAHSTAVGANE
jgi:putative endonuclease